MSYRGSTRNPELPGGRTSRRTVFTLSVLLPFLSVFAPGVTSAACGPFDVDYALYGGKKLDIRKDVEVNGIEVTGKGKALEPDGDLMNPDPAPALPDLVPSTFPVFDSDSHNHIPDNGSGSLGEGTYHDVKPGENADFTFTTVGGTYQIEKIEAKKGATITFAPGDYFIEELKLKENTQLLISPAGPVRIYIKEKAEFGKQSQVNLGGSVANLQIYGYDDVDIKLKEEAKVSALIYSPDDKSKIEMEKEVEFRGMAVTAGEVKVGKEASFTFDAAVQSEVGSISTCVVPHARYLCRT